MPTPPTVAHAPTKALMVFDGECHFCRRWISRWQEETGDQVDYAPLQDVAATFPEVPRSSFEQEVKLILPDGRVYGGADAVFRCLNLAAQPGWLSRLGSWLYRCVPGFAPVTETAYHFVARHRTLASTITRWLWGDDVTRPTYYTARVWFLRALAAIFFIAFLSLRWQIDGLVGHDGILPFAPLLDAARQQLGGLRAFLALPTLCWWIGASDGALHFLCNGGMVLSALLLVGLAPPLCLFLLWIFYLSVAVAGQTFLSFQWDVLLLETAFLSIFLAPMRVWPGRFATLPPLALFLLRWLLFRLMLMSGIVKLTSGDASWLGFSALAYHYETQPLPTWVGWYFHQAPHAFQIVSTIFLFGVEIIVPFFVWGPRRVRTIGFALLVLLQLLIAATGNYGFFNLLTMALCLLLLDDRQWPRWLTPRHRRNSESSLWWRWPNWALAIPAVVFVGLGVLLLWQALFPSSPWPRPLETAYAAVEPFRTINGYGLFRTMTRSRPEIVLEGSNDAEHWQPYQFRWKPGDLSKRPMFIAPYMPRLDWQMWFAALGSYRDNPWFPQLAVKLLQGSPAVLALLDVNPFPQAPPKYLRARIYEYHFTSMAEHRQTGDWWRRGEPCASGEYLPPISLRTE